MTAEAKQLYEALLEHGPLDKVRLRREARLTSDGNAVSASAKGLFDRCASAERRRLRRRSAKAKASGAGFAP